VLTNHSLSADAFMDLAVGEGDSAAVRMLCEAEHSKHRLWLVDAYLAADEVDPPTRATAAFQAGLRLLDQASAADAAAVARLFTLPYIGSWAHDCRVGVSSGSVPDFGYLACVAAAAAIPLGIPFEIEAPVRDDRVVFPGLGCLPVADQGDWIRLSSDGERLRAGQHIEVACADLVPDDGSGTAVPGEAVPGEPVRQWQGTPLVRAVAEGRAWEVLLETVDRHLDRYAIPMVTALAADEVMHWRQLIQGAWELLVRHHAWAAGPIPDGVAVIVPLVQQSYLDSAASPAAFGAIATSVPPSPVSLAEVLIHEFQHVKLGGLIDVVPLVEPCEERGYAPWREDPRPVGGLLQGVYAFTGIAHFWDVQRHIETEPDDILRASVLYERWHSSIAAVTGTLLGAGALTPDGVRFVTALRERGPRQDCGPVSPEAMEIARAVALDNWLTWQLRHIALDAEGVAMLAAAFLRGEPFSRQAFPEASIEDDTRKIDSMARSRLLNLRFQEPQRYRELSAATLTELSAADALLIQGNASAAVAAYREGLAVGPDPAAWIGLALAVDRLSEMPSRPVFAAQLPLLFEMHASLSHQGIHADPLDMAHWFE
jgi:HEXXH motif-containing protein